MKNDSGSITFTPPHFTNPDHPLDFARRYPTAYTKFTKPKVEMKFEANVNCPPGTTRTVIIKATGSDGVELPPQTFSLPRGNSTQVYGPHDANGPFPDKILFYGPGLGTFEFDWKVKIESQEFSNFDKSNHRIYLTAGIPSCLQGNRETLFYYACHQPNGNAGTSGKDVTHLIAVDFSSKAMRRIDSESGFPAGDNMTFWPGSPSLLEYGSGVCAAWTDFFCDVLKVHNYDSDRIDIDSLNVIFDDTKKHAGSCWAAVGTSQSLVTGPGAPKNGGQGPGNPSRTWVGHRIAKAFGEYYDPSYGIGPAVDEKDYENQSVSWYGYSYSNLIMSHNVFQPRVPGTGNKLNYTKAP